jgi:stringent starvation protein B
MHSNRPYLLKAFFDWIVDNQCTPYIIVDAYYAGVEVPQEFVNDGQIVLNIAPRAVSNFSINDTSVEFSTRFNGMPLDLFIPTLSIIGIYAQENGKGMMFEAEESIPPPPAPPAIVKGKSILKRESTESTSKSKPSLRVVK